MNRELQDVADITTAINRYSLAIDMRRWPLMDEVFHPDGEIVMGDMRFTARDGVAYIRACIEYCSITHHANSNVMVDLDGDSAQAITAVRAWHRGGRDDAVTLECVGHYLDDFVRTRAGWRIVRRDERVTVTQGDFAIFAGTDEVRDQLLATSTAAFSGRG